ncbi:hypothetical protein SDC9_150874 [bioreactor metagenome]|uniref:Uncharacterized protein n=1 Tax=bioreactor metagenome TaxID=1076179 RepID=A0A645ET01_9ZZZZ
MEGRGGGPGAEVGRLVHRVAVVSTDPLEGDVAALHRLVEGLDQIDVQHGLTVGLLPALPLPALGPLGDHVDRVLAVAQHVQRLADVGGLLQQVQHRHQLAHVVGAVRPAAAGPAVVVDVPGPAGRSWIAEG